MFPSVAICMSPRAQHIRGYAVYRTQQRAGPREPDGGMRLASPEKRHQEQHAPAPLDAAKIDGGRTIRRGASYTLVAEIASCGPGTNAGTVAIYSSTSEGCLAARLGEMGPAGSTGWRTSRSSTAADRCGALVEQSELSQWFIKITDTPPARCRLETLGIGRRR